MADKIKKIKGSPRDTQRKTGISLSDVKNFYKNKKNKKVTKTAKNLSELKSGKIKTLPISSEQQNNKGKKKLQSAFNKG